MNAMVMSGNLLNWIRKNAERADAWVLSITPAMAQALLDSQVKNRPVSEGRVHYYRKQIRANRWRFTGQGIIIARTGRLVDGQHRLLALIAEGATLSMLVVCGVEEDVWTCLDDGMKRQAADYLENGKHRHALAAALGAIWREGHGKIGGRMPTGTIPGGLIASLNEVFPEVAQVVRDYHDWNWRALMVPHMWIYSIARMHHYDPVRADEFVSRLKDGVGLTEGSPIYLLRERLLRDRADKKKKTRPEETQALIIKAWSAFVRGQKLKYLRFRTEGPQAEEFPVWPGGPIELPANVRDV